MKIAALMTVRDEADILQATLDSAAIWIDEIYAIDNGSIDGSFDILNDHHVVKKAFRDLREFNESQFMVELLNMSKGSDATWFVDLDADEHYDPKIRVSLENCPMEFNTVSVTIRYMVGNRCYREHQQWSRIYRNDPSQFAINHIRKLHGGKIPIPREFRKVYHSGIQVKHYQIRSYEQGMRKYENYMLLDPNLQYQESYDHLRQLAMMFRYGDFTGLRFLEPCESV